MATGKSKDKESKGSSKKESKGFRKTSSGATASPGGSEDVDTSEAASLVALLATQAMKEEKKRLKPGLKQRKKGGKAVNKKISE
jgi:hypothetical protein